MVPRVEQTASPGAVVRHAQVELRWTPGWEWLTSVVAIHVVVVAPWLAVLGPWLLGPGLASLLYHVLVFRRREVWRLTLVEESVTVFEPRRPGAPPRWAKLRGPPWMTDRWLVVRTTRRVLILRAGRYDPAHFARLRRALLAV